MVTRSRRSGSILLIVLGMLVVLSILAVAFARLTSLERDAAHGVSLSTQARFVAEAGLEVAMQRLLADYALTLVDGTGGEWRYGDPPTTPIEASTRPSYGKDASAVWRSITVGGTSYGYSGSLGPPPGAKLDPEGAQYVLKIVDLSGRINVNDRVAGSAADDARLATLLDNLGLAITQYTMLPDPVSGRGASIVSYRNALPGGRFRTIADLWRVPGFTRAEVELLGEYLTVHGWQEAVVVPKPQTTMTDFDLDFATTLRTPVNLNVAPEPVLFALLVGLRARCPFPAGNGAYGLAASNAIDGPTAVHLVDKIVERRQAPGRPIRSMYDLAEFFDKHLHGAFTGYMPILMANFNPNAHLTKFNSDHSHDVYGLGVRLDDPADDDDVPLSASFPICDKTDLLYHTTEATFSSMGFFEITSLGRLVAQGADSIVASYKILQTVQLFDVARHSTQRDFERNAAGLFRARTYPENMPDQGIPFPWQRASALDGQVALDDRQTNAPAAGTGWYTDFDSRLHQVSTLSNSTTSMRWTSSIRHEGFPAGDRNPDVRHNQPVYTGEGFPSLPQDPADRGLLGEMLPPAQRTLSLASDLHPDGIWYDPFPDWNDNRWRDLVFDGVDGELPSAAGLATYYPDLGCVEFWIKPDNRWRPNVLGPSTCVAGLLGLHTFEDQATIPFSGTTAWGGPYSANSFLGVYQIPGTWFFYQSQGCGVDGSVHRLARRASDWAYSGADYGWRDYQGGMATPDLNALLRPRQWNHVRMQWSYAHNPALVVNIPGQGVHAYTYFAIRQVFVNGVLAWTSAPGPYLYWWAVTYLLMNPPSLSYLVMPGDNQTGYLSAGYTYTMDPSFGTDRRSTATVDQLRAYPRLWKDGILDHYDPTNGWSFWRGSFTLPSAARILSIRYTAYPGRSGDPLAPPSSTRLEWTVGGASGMTETFANEAQNGVAPAATVDEVASALTYTFWFYDSPNGGATPQVPFVQSPYVDDVTIYSTTGPRILDRVEGF